MPAKTRPLPKPGLGVPIDVTRVDSDELGMDQILEKLDPVDSVSRERHLLYEVEAHLGGFAIALEHLTFVFLDVDGYGHAYGYERII